VVRASIAPDSDKKGSFMFEEACKFEKQNGDSFDAIVPYKTDNSWFSLLKDTIDRIQKLPRWEVVPTARECSTGQNNSPSPDVSWTGKSTPDGNNNSLRVSKTTDDVPDQIQDLLNGHTNQNK